MKIKQISKQKENKTKTSKYKIAKKHHIFLRKTIYKYKNKNNNRKYDGEKLQESKQNKCLTKMQRIKKKQRKMCV